MLVELLRASTGSPSCEPVSGLDKREYLMIIQDNFSYFSIKPYVLTPHLNRLVETVQMRGHNICF